MFVLEYPTLRAAADLLTTVAYQTPWVGCRGARLVTFHMAATNANALATSVIEIRRKGGTAITLVAGGNPTKMITVAGATTPAAMNAGGTILCCNALDHAALLVDLPMIPAWDEARLSVTGHATLTIAGFAVQAQVLFDEPTRFSEL